MTKTYFKRKLFLVELVEQGELAVPGALVGRALEGMEVQPGVGPLVPLEQAVVVLEENLEFVVP